MDIVVGADPATDAMVDVDIEPVKGNFIVEVAGTAGR